MRFVMFLKRLPGLISLPQLMSWGGSRQAFHGGSEYAEALADVAEKGTTRFLPGVSTCRWLAYSICIFVKNRFGIRYALLDFF